MPREVMSDRARGKLLLTRATDEQAKVLVALMEARHLVQSGGVNAWEWYDGEPTNPARDALVEVIAGSDADILALRDALRARKEGGGDGLPPE